ncbi:PIN domain-containing protein [Acidicapsa ligni]|uniref:PIN domain-containing protein n=1 Tax=Acidicapsa ligni TaxID=542300 RepID=UPI0021E084B3|nr:PIN domain-containing protein [Acidicapsa ligni]
MAGNPVTDAVHLDTQFFVSSAFSFNSNKIESLKRHFASGRLRLILTDITIAEVHARIRKTVAEELLLHRQFVNQVKALHNSSLQPITSLLVKAKDDEVAADLSHQFDTFLHENGATTIYATKLSAEDVFKKYFSAEPPFGTAENKRHEFPDAFVVEALAGWTEGENSDLLVVTDDKLFGEACASSEAAERLHIKKTLTDLLNHVASDDEFAEYLRAEVMKHMAEIEKQATEEFEGYFFWVEDENGEAEVHVTQITHDGDVEILEIDEDEALFEMSFEVKFTAKLSYDDSATASYDREDGSLIYVEHRRESVDREASLTAEVRVQFDREAKTGVDHIEVSVVDPSDGFGIETSSNYGYPWK